jgi:hypothetical protein
MGLRRIDLDYRPAPRRFGRALLGIGMAAAGVTALAWIDMKEEARVWERAAAAVQRPASNAAAQDPELARRLDQANEVIHRLSLPWEALFRNLEQAASNRIALLAMEPDPGQGKIMLAGEAQAYGEVLQYMTRLESGAVLGQPRLLSHAVREDGPSRPVAFAITAQWRTAP